MRRISVSGMEQSSDPDIFISLFNERLFIIHDHFIASILSSTHRGCATINRWIKGGHTFWFTVCATYGWINNDLIYVYDRPLVRGIDNDLRYVAIGNLSRVSLCLTIRRSWSIDASDYVTSRGTRKLGNREVRSSWKTRIQSIGDEKELTARCRDTSNDTASVILSLVNHRLSLSMRSQLIRVIWFIIYQKRFSCFCFFLMLDEVSIILLSWSNLNYDSQLSDIILLDLFFSPIIIIDRKKKKIWKLVNWTTLFLYFCREMSSRENYTFEYTRSVEKLPLETHPFKRKVWSIKGAKLRAR